MSGVSLPTLLALLALTTLVVLLPMLPALMEWWRPSDVTPLFIDKDDALDPSYLARSLVSNLAAAQALRQTHLGRSPITTLPPRAAWPFDDQERAAATTRRVWDLVADAELPAGMAFLGEVAARQSLRAATQGLYRALWVRHQLSLPSRCTVLRWAHATHIDIGPGCDLAGRVTADEAITLAGGTHFVLLHAPVLRFAPMRADRVPPPVATPACTLQAAPAGGRAERSLQVGDGQAWTGDLVCRGDLHLGAGCHVQGSLKAHGTITLGPGCTVTGSLVSRGPLTLGPGCAVGGQVVSEVAIALGEACVIGAPDRICTVTAPRIDVDAGVAVHGTVWAGKYGRCTATATAVPEPAVAPARSHSATPVPEAVA